jgi:choline dehydrogenase-like flavoprotein
MLIEARDLASGTTLETDVCIVGGGPAGITLACELADGGTQVLLLEAGGRRFSPAAQAGLTGEVAAGSAHSPPQMYRRRIFGGATTIWGGRCVPLEPLDLERRRHVPFSGWPIGWQELSGYYERAQPYFDAGPVAYSVGATFGANAPSTISGFADQDICSDRLERFSPPVDFGKAYIRRFATSTVMTLVLGAQASRLETGGQTVTGLHAASSLGRGFTVRARRYVLAAGGLETPRLLMVSDGTRRGGLGNEGGALGRYYMCHIENTLGRLRMCPVDRPIVLHFEKTVDGIYVRRQFALSALAQTRDGLLNTAFRLHYDPIADPAHRSGILSAMYFAKDAVLPEYRRKLAAIEIANRDRLKRDGRFWLAHGRNVLRDAPAVSRFGIDWLRRRTFAARKLPAVVIHSRDGSYPLDVNAEQVPNAESRVTLAGSRDQFDIPLLRVDWRPTAQDFDSLTRTMRLLRNAFDRSGCARLEFDDAEIGAAIARSTPIGGHHLGTTRMSDHPSTGVVDSNGAVHGLANLYVTGGAVFPTCGHANPTLTIVALSVRLAKHLSAMRARGQVFSGTPNPKTT